MTIKVTIPNTSSDSVTFGSGNTPTAAQVIGIDSGSSNGQLAFNTTASGTSTERMRIDSSGNVGIGTSSPSVKLEVNGAIKGNGVTLNGYDVIGGGTSNYLSLYSNSAGPYIVVRGATGGSQGIEFGTGGTERARIDSSGNLLVGGTNQSNGGKTISYFNGSTLNGFVAYDTAGASGTTFFMCSLNGTNIGTIARVGATSAVTYNTTSDQRLKSNIEDAAPVLEKLMTVQVRQYDWTEGDLHQDYGFVAQELEPILSGIVTQGKTEEDMWQMDYSRLTPHLVKAIQEQQALITTLTESFATLTARIESLEAK
jgi:hypothetical protein